VKTSHILFKKPVKILQVFSNIVYYHKDEKSFTDRQHKLAWRPVASLHGGVVDGQLFLPEPILKQPRLQHCDLITIVDDISLERHHQRDLESNTCLILDVPRPIGVFNLVQKEELELHLHYNHFCVGTPERENFKICSLRVGEPVEVKINGKIDFSLTGRRARLFIEQQYIFHYLETFASAQVLKPPVSAIQKTIPYQRNLVDLWKPLW